MENYQDIDFDNELFGGTNPEEKKETRSSKRALKKIMKQKVWAQTKLRAKQLKKQKKRGSKVQVPERPTVAKVEGEEIEKPIVKKQRQILKEKVKQGQRIIIDLGFWDLMTQKQYKSLMRQLAYCQNFLKKSVRPLNIAVCGYTQPIRTLFQSDYNAQYWSMDFREDLVQDCQFQNLVYLTADADQILDQLKPQQIYIIGGIVDHNRHKRLTYNFALQRKIRIAKLPLHLSQVTGSRHLTVNHVVELLGRRSSGQAWESCLKCLPQRKLGEGPIEKGGCN